MSECPVCLGVSGYDVHICGKGGFDMPEQSLDARAWNGSTSAEQQLVKREIDSLREMAKEANDLAALKAENANLKTVMIAAAEELATHWGAHCDADGYGPQNLLHRLEGGIPSEYGYTAGAFTTLTSDLAAAREELSRAREAVITLWASEDLMLDFDGLSACIERAKARYAREIAQEQG